MIRAAFKGDMAKVKSLLTKGADVNTKANDSLTALIQAAYFGDTDIVKVLLANTADVNAKHKNGLAAAIAAKKMRI